MPAWTTYVTAVGALVNVLVLVGVGLAVWGHMRWRALEEYEKLAEARGERIRELEKDTAKLKAQHETDLEYLRARVEALEAQVAELQKLNVELQRRLNRQDTAPRPRKTEAVDEPAD